MRDAWGDVARRTAADGWRLALGGVRRLEGILRWRVLLVDIWGLGQHWEVNIDLKPLDFLVDEAEGGGDDGIGSLDALKCEYTELEFVQGSWGGILEGLDLQKEDGCGRVDAVCLR